MHLVDELSVYPAYGVPSVPVQLLWAGSLQLLPHTLQASPAQAGLCKQVGFRRSSRQVVAGALADKAMQVGAAHAAGLVDRPPVAKQLFLLFK